MTLSNLDLYEYDAAQTEQSSSTSAIDNVEQVRGVQAGPVIYKVKDQSSTVDGADAEPFALAATNPLTPLAAPRPAVSLSLDRTHALQGQDVTVTETVSNTSNDIPGSAATASLTLPSGVTVTSGGSTTWTPAAGTLAAGATVSHQWTVNGTSDGLGQLSANAQLSAYGETFNGSTSATIDVDSTPPVPSLSCPASGGTNPRLALSWDASDASTVTGYDLDVSADGTPYARWLTGATQTSAAYTGQPGHEYGFRLRATDELGNVSGFVTCAPVSIGFAPVAPPAPLPGPTQLLPAPARLRLATAAVRRGRLLVRGRLADRATGFVSCTYSARRHRAVRGRTAVRHGVYRLSLRLPTGETRGLLSIRYSGDHAFAPQRISRRVT
jgi:hypothetical protein